MGRALGLRPPARCYVGVFAATSVLAGQFVFCQQIPPATRVGLAVILSGGAVMQFGPAD
jgi:multidrug transporter EmrE-like cation transporter